MTPSFDLNGLTLQAGAVYSLSSGDSDKSFSDKNDNKAYNSIGASAKVGFTNDAFAVSAATDIGYDIENEKFGMDAVAREAGAAALLYASDDDPPVVSVSTAEANPQLFDWLSLIDFNVLVILVLMTVVAGFNMISGLLILLFENISTIGILKSMGMTDGAIVKVFLRTSSVIVLKGMAAGNLLAFLFCLIQGSTHIIALDPSNYFISYVPVHLQTLKILAADAAAYIVIMLLLLLPSMFISRIDPAKTVRMS